jgi:hypothetical protein
MSGRKPTGHLGVCRLQRCITVTDVSLGWTTPHLLVNRIFPRVHEHSSYMQLQPH